VEAQQHTPLGPLSKLHGKSDCSDDCTFRWISSGMTSSGMMCCPGVLTLQGDEHAPAAAAAAAGGYIDRFAQLQPLAVALALILQLPQVPERRAAPAACQPVSLWPPLQSCWVVLQQVLLQG